MSSEEPISPGVHRVAAISAFSAIAVGAVAVLAWIAGIEVLKGATVILLVAIGALTARSLNQALAERRGLEERVRELAIKDSLTNLLNRRGFEQELNNQLALARRYGNRVAVIALDLDGLADINRSYGDQVGDELLVALARAWSSELRLTDSIARLGNDEFVVILPQADPTGAEETVAAKLVQVARETVVVAGAKRLRTTISAGIGVSRGTELSRTGLLQMADQTLYRAKAAGGDRWIALTQVDSSPTPTA